MSEVEIEVVTSVTDELLEAWNALLPQLSKTASPLTPEQVQRFVESDAISHFVAKLDGRIVGSLTLAVFPTPTGLRSWIEDVVVDQSARGRGIGEKLIQAATELGSRMEVRTIDLTSRPSREAANRLYQRAGFQLREANVYRYAPEA